MKFWLVLLIIYFSSCSKFDFQNITNPAYSIGLVSNYSSGGQTRAIILFDYEAKGKLFSKFYGNGDYHWNVPSSGIHLGDKYMVQYDSLDPGTARMLFSYPVPDSATYKTYIALFKKTPPGYPSP